MNQNTDFIPYAKPSLDSEEEKAVCAVLRSGWLTTGKETLAFEEEFATFLRIPYAMALNSGTAGLHLGLEGVGVSTGSWVMTTPYTFTASAEIIRYLGADPWFVDIDETTYNIDPGLMEKALVSGNRRVSGIIPVHIGGYPCEMETINQLAGKYGIPVIEDAAHAFPGSYKGQYMGTLGTAGVFSFYANKTMTTGEGGMIVTGNKNLAERVQIMRLHGIDREAWDRYTRPDASWFYDVVEPGFKYNLTDLAASIGRIQLKKAVSFMKQREQIAQTYIRAFKDLDYLSLPPGCDGHSWHLFLLRIKPDTLTISRDEFIIKMRQAGIGTSVHFIPLHLMTYYKKRYGFHADDFPKALKNYSTSMSLPIYPGLEEEQIRRIINTVTAIGSSAYKKGYGVKEIPGV